MWRRKRIARRSLVWSGRSRECKRRTSVCDGSWKRPCERPSDRRRRFSGEIGKRIPEKRDGKQARTTGCRCRREIPDRVEGVVEVALPGRGFRPAAAVLGAGFDGFLVRDGWSVYRQFAQALHQSCLAPLLRRCRKMIQAAGGRGSPYPRAVQTLLQSSLRLRDRRNRGRISPHGLAVARGQLEARLDRVLQKRTRSLANRRLANHILRERNAVFTFLYCPGLEATNWRAEQAIRPMMVTRKVWGANRTAAGAQAQSILLRILQTCRQQNRPVLPLLERLLCSPRPQLLDLATP